VHISDGASNTILLAEDAGRPRLWQAGNMGPDQKLEGGAWNHFKGGIVLRGSTPDGTWPKVPGPCAVNCINDGEVYGFHPSGANTVFADGSVRLLVTGTSIRVLAALITRAGGEVVSAGDFSRQAGREHPSSRARTRIKSRTASGRGEGWFPTVE